MRGRSYDSIGVIGDITRRDFLKIGGAVGIGVLLGDPSAWAEESQSKGPEERIRTNIQDALSIPRTKNSLPGPFPGRVVEVQHEGAMRGNGPVPEVVSSMCKNGLERLAGGSSADCFSRLFEKDDVVGIKVNPVGAGLISTRPEVVDAVIEWLLINGIRKKNIVIWDRFDFMLREAGFRQERFPGICIEGLQTMAEGEKKDFGTVIDEKGTHISAGNFDRDVYYWADVKAPEDREYLNQHVFNGNYSYFGKLITKRLTKIINIPVFKNTGNGISMATKNLGYGSICNTNRLHKPLGFNVNTEVLAFPVIRDKLVLNIIDGLRAQYDGGPMPAAKFAYTLNTLFFATDPFALDMICHHSMVKKRKSMGVKVSEHPRFTEYLSYGERLGLGIADPRKIEHLTISSSEGGEGRE